MNVSLTPELVGFVKEQVAGGMYHSSSEVIREGLRLLKEQKEDRRVRLEELRKQVAAGLEQLERGERILGEDVFRELEERNHSRLKS